MKLRTFFMLFALWIGVVAFLVYVGNTEAVIAQRGVLIHPFPFWLHRWLLTVVVGGFFALLVSIGAIKRKEEKP